MPTDTNNELLEFLFDTQEADLVISPLASLPQRAKVMDFAAIPLSLEYTTILYPFPDPADGNVLLYIKVGCDSHYRYCH